VIIHRRHPTPLALALAALAALCVASPASAKEPRETTLTAAAKKNVLNKRGVKVAGQLQPTKAGRRIVIQRKDGEDWESVAKTRTADDGTYRGVWKRPKPGTYAVRVRFRGDDANAAAKTQVDHPVRVYRGKEATWYGPGLYGNRTACGQTLRPDTVGVAHKELPCGTKVRFYYKGRSEKVRVIDRGPFVKGIEWDLTEAARKKLRFPDRDEIWSTR